MPIEFCYDFSQLCRRARQGQGIAVGSARRFIGLHEWRQWAGMIYPGEGKKGEPKAGDYVLAAERVRAEAAASPDRSTAYDLARADKWEGQARTKQLPSTRTEIGAGGELIDIENRWDALGVVDTVADPDYVTASASRERRELAGAAGSLDLALDAADTIQGQDSLEKMLVHQMAVLHRGMMRAAARMNEELYAARDEAANVRACRLAGAISRMSAAYQQALRTLLRKRTGGNQHVTVKHIHQQVNVTEGGQALLRCGHAERALQASWWQEHGAAHAGGPSAQQAGKLETRALFAGSQGGTVARTGGNACGPLSTRLDLRPRRSRGRIRTTPDHLSRRTDWHR